jgi:hypothetical protein
MKRFTHFTDREGGFFFRVNREFFEPYAKPFQAPSGVKRTRVLIDHSGKVSGRLGGSCCGYKKGFSGDSKGFMLAIRKIR